MTSDFKGVSRGEASWRACTRIENVTVHLGSFAVEGEAAAAYDMAAILLYGKQVKGLNYPLANYLDGDGNVIEDQSIKERLQRKGWVTPGGLVVASCISLTLITWWWNLVRTHCLAYWMRRARELSSSFRGVCRLGNNKWRAQIRISDVKVQLGLFTDEGEAAAAYDMAALLLNGKQAIKLNFPLSNYLDSDGNIIVDQGIKERLGRRATLKDSEAIKSSTVTFPAGSRPGPVGPASRPSSVETVCQDRASKRARILPIEATDRMDDCAGDQGDGMEVRLSSSSSMLFVSTSSVQRLSSLLLAGSAAQQVPGLGAIKDRRYNSWAGHWSLLGATRSRGRCCPRGASGHKLLVELV